MVRRRSGEDRWQEVQGSCEEDDRSRPENSVDIHGSSTLPAEILLMRYVILRFVGIWKRDNICCWIFYD